MYYVCSNLLSPIALRVPPRLSIGARGRCHPVAGDTLELGFVSCLALQTLSVEYFGRPYVPTISHHPAVDSNGGSSAPMQDMRLGTA